MITFNMAANYITATEGGYVNHPSDPGGETKYGISKRAFPNEDIASLTVARASELYRVHYWLAAGCDRLPSPLNLAVFDAAVHHGPGTAIRLLQRALKLHEDGILGKQTLLRVTLVPAVELSGLYLATRLGYIESLNSDAFSAGWRKRVCILAFNMGTHMPPTSLSCREDTTNG